MLFLSSDFSWTCWFPVQRSRLGERGVELAPEQAQLGVSGRRQDEDSDRTLLPVPSSPSPSLRTGCGDSVFPGSFWAGLVPSLLARKPQRAGEAVPLLCSPSSVWSLHQLPVITAGPACPAPFYGTVKGISQLDVVTQGPKSYGEMRQKRENSEGAFLSWIPQQ